MSDHFTKHIFDGLLFGTSLAVTAILYKVYAKSQTTVDQINKAKVHENYKSLKRDTAQQDTFYTGLTGKVGPLTADVLPSSMPNSSLKGVLKQEVTNEHRSRWNRLTQMWFDTVSAATNTLYQVPFAVQLDDGHKVEIKTPLEIQDLTDTLETTYSHFRPKETGLASSVLDALQGDRVKGYEDIERLLLVGTNVLVLGRTEIDRTSKRIAMHPPNTNFAYILTNLTKSQLIEKLSQDVFFYKLLSCISCAVSVLILLYLGRKFIVHLNSYATWRRLSKRLNDQRDKWRNRFRSPPGDDDTDDVIDYPMDRCIICVTLPRDVCFLECSHVCVCHDCAQLLTDNKCPVCRAVISRQIPLFVP